MDDLSPTDLKTILHSKRANLYYLEHCRVLVNGGRVEYVTDEGRRQLYWNIPIANTTVVLLGTGTSVTQAAMRELAKAGVMVGFCGGGGTPLFSGVEAEIAVEWCSPQSEYRPTEYLQQWVRFWFDDDKRLRAARHIQRTRISCIQKEWQGRRLRDSGFEPDAVRLDDLLCRAKARIDQANDVNALLTDEARLAKELFKLAARTVDYGEFNRAKRGSGADPANRFLDHGNYLAYGLAAAAAWVLGLPHGLAVLHGKTRRGGLVFDAADLVKDAIVLPQASLSAIAGHDCRAGSLEILTGTADDTIHPKHSIAIQPSMHRIGALHLYPSGVRQESDTGAYYFPQVAANANFRESTTSASRLPIAHCPLPESCVVQAGPASGNRFEIGLVSP